MRDAMSKLKRISQLALLKNKTFTLKPTRIIISELVNTTKISTAFTV